ncbi:M16 family metallopeptidase [Acanthopleuribacter pedis]|uniref:Insulinase family protein n=1 Tax=Acanthopleuribacter pedis TaxID=442870 RepID=A0A8J7QCX7_9BACT|nr:pitrilysin family protein [Acanthopleuribacter pedis]MBO1318716.1 insulinase family protein [Acanthopleuribacter pedis]
MNVSRCLVWALVFSLFLGVSTLQADDHEEGTAIFPYKYHLKDFDNGLRVIVIPTGIPNLVSLQIPVQTGSRNEVEPGKSGFAHFFEHMMFRGSENISSEEYNATLKNIGADQNAYTTDDFTNYHITFSKDDLDTVMRLEADRFRYLSYPEADFKTEARAILGEYNKNSANPIMKILERQRDLAFSNHTYRHTTMGFLKDIKDMPNQFEYSREFFKRYYRPEKIVIVLAGDVDPEGAFGLVEKYWGDWERGTYESDIPTEPAPTGPKYEHIAWPAPTLPMVAVGFRGPAVSETELDMAAMDIIAEIAFSSSSPLYQKLVLKEQKANSVQNYFPNRIDPYLVTAFAQLKSADDIAAARDDILAAFANLRTEKVAEQRLNEIKDNLKYSFAMGLTSSNDIASALVPWLALTRDPESINRYYRLYDQITPDVVHRVANTYFVDHGLVVVTVAQGEIAEDLQGHGSIEGIVTKSKETVDSKVKTHLIESPSPVLNFRFMFHTGAAVQKPEHAGIAALTTAMIANGGSKTLDYSAIQKAFFPMATGFGVQVDKEMTVFRGSIHQDNLDTYYTIIKDQMLQPAWDEDDFERVKNQLKSSITINLRSNNDEELGKEVLYEFIYQGHPYGTLNAGHISKIDKLTLADLKAFYAEHFTQNNLTVGMAGNFPEGFADRVKRDFAALPEGKPAAKMELPAPKTIDGLHVQIVEKETRATALSMGFPIEVNRSHPDFAALWLARSYFGEHRSTNSYLFQRMRELRGMNYGDYAYIEYFPNGMFLTQPNPNYARQQQIFQIWVRPVPPEQAAFALRIAKYELDKLVKDGMSKKDFEATRNFLIKFVNVLTGSDNRRLGYAMDSEFYGMKDFNQSMVAALKKLKLKDVNRAIKKHLQGDNMKIVFITKDAQGLADQLLSGEPTPIQYGSEKPAEILEEDKIIEKYPIKLSKENVEIIPVDKVFN